MLTNSDGSACKHQRIQAVGHVSSKVVRHQRINYPQSRPASVLDALYQQGSARIRFPHTQPGQLQAVLLNTAGGLTGNDHLQWQATAGSHSHMCISTAACEKVYRTHGPAASQETTLKVSSQARLEWLPQESILFNGANLDRTLHVELEDHAEVLIVESLIFGRQAMNEATNNIKVRDRWRIHRDNRLIHAEDFRLDMHAGTNALRQCLMHQYSAISTIVLVTNKQREWCDAIVGQLGQSSHGNTNELRMGASILPSRLVVRVLATNSFQLRKFLIPCIELLNEGRSVPTVWNV